MNSRKQVERTVPLVQLVFWWLIIALGGIPILFYCFLLLAPVLHEQFVEPEATTLPPPYYLYDDDETVSVDPTQTDADSNDSK